MSPLDFVTLAVSKDKTRSCLTGVYRDKTHLVATDGHRMHLAPTPSGTPGYLDGRDEVFPDWDMVTPKGTPQASTSIQCDSWFADKLKALTGVSKCNDRAVPTLVITCKENKLTFEVRAPKPEDICASFTWPTLEVTETPEFTVGLNAQYLLDVVQATSKICKVGFPIDLHFHGETGPFKIEVPTLGTAIIMPIRLQ